MNTIKSNSKPVGIILLSSFYAFGALVLLVMWMIEPIQTSRTIAERHGLPSTIGTWILPLIGALALIIAGGLFSLQRWFDPVGRSARYDSFRELYLVIARDRLPTPDPQTIS